MLTLGPLVFTTPWILLALGVLPLIYWLLRVTPPAPRLQRFPAIRLLYDLVAQEETPERTPWWLLLMRLALAAIVILALARPLLNPGADLPGSGPVMLVVDNGWAAARDWPARQRQMSAVIDRAEREDRRLIVLTTAARSPNEAPEPTGLLRPAEARGLAESLTPVPWATDREAALEAVRDLQVEGSAHVVWLTDGLGDPAVVPLAERLQRLGSAEAVIPERGNSPHLLEPPATAGSDLVARIRRVHGADGAGDQVWLRVIATDGRLLSRQQVTFESGETVAEARVELPVELRNEAIRMEIEGETTAGAVVLLDERWRRRPVGLITGGLVNTAQPLLTDTHYLTQALDPYSEVRRGDAAELLESGIAVLILPDAGALTDQESEAVERWIGAGGVLVRFAGPLLAANPDPLVPVRLRNGDRILTGTLSWTEPMPLAPFEENSPFFGLPVPDDVLIERQVLAEPSLDLAGKTWARLGDGTPLVTADRMAGSDGRGGWLVLVHTTAGPEWSNLPLSGLFVDMLRRVVALSEGVQGDAGSQNLKPLQLLDGLGRLVTPSATAVPINAANVPETPVSPEHPPGFYGTEESRRALNLGDSVEDLAPIDDLPNGVAVAGYAPRGEVDLMPLLLALALAFTAIDMIIALVLRGLLRIAPRRAAAGMATVLLAAGIGIAISVSDAQAQDDEAMFLQAANGTYLAYVRVGIPEIDEVSQAGLDGLSAVLFARTAVESDGAIGVDVAVDELAFFPLLYWPVVPEQRPLSDATIARLNDYLRNGGTILFDTRDQALGGGGTGPGAQRLRLLTEGMDIPPLAPVPPDHVLTKAFYLMQDFPGRYAGGELWVENAEEHINDGVSSVIIGANDWASAWAVGGNGTPLFPVVPGGEQQREMAYRFGVNLVMYALTGNYKADQVHVPAILERLGQ